MKATAKTFLVLCRRMWRAREERDRAYQAADFRAWQAAKSRADKLERTITGLILS